MEQVRIGRLDNLCEAIAETRAHQNELRQTEAGNEQAALRVMQQYKASSYRHAGVELVRVPGDEKLRVRTQREPTASSDAAGDGDEAGDDNVDEDQGADQDTGEDSPAGDE